MTQTIKQHLAAMRSDLESRCSDCSAEGTCCYKEFKLLGHIYSIEAMLDSLMTSAKEWAKLIWMTTTDQDIEGHKYAFNNITAYVRAIQQDALTSKLPEVDLRKLAEETMDAFMKVIQSYAGIPTEEEELIEYYRVRNERLDIIHEALKKARGGV